MFKRSTLFVTLLSVSAGLAPAANRYLQHNLVSDQTTAGADHVDPNLVNAWGICTSATSPFWISDAGTGLSTLYTSFGTPNATTKPAVPATSTTVAGGSPTGCVSNTTAATFLIPTSTGTTSSFIFATENGSISGWASAVNPAQAIVMIDNSSKGAVYKGLAISGARLYAANFNAGTIEVYDGSWQPVSLPGAFTDPGIPAGFAPFDVQTLAGKVYVTYAKQDAAKHDDVAGAGNGFVDVYDTNGLLLNHLISNGNLNSPWGIAIAPAGFGDFANNLLVGNFGDGTINVYNPTTGAFLASLQDANGSTIRIGGLWGLRVGNGGNGGDVNAVYFAAGPGGEKHGLFGSLQAAPAITANSISNAASYATTVAPGGFVVVQGTNLAATQRTWATADFVAGKLPTSLDGVTATVNGKPAFVYYVSPTQIDLIPAADTTQGSVPVVITNNGIVSTAASVTMAAYAPGFFISKNNYIAATHADGTLIGPTTLYPNNSTPAKAGETIVLYATGLGATSPSQDGLVVTTAVPTATQPTVTVNGVTATVTYSGLTSAGLNQINIVVPTGTASGDQTVSLTIGGVKSQATALISVL